MDLIRLCSLYHEGFVELTNEFSAGRIFTERPRFEGRLQQLFNDLAAVYHFPGFNYTIVSSKFIGRQNEHGNFSGCNGLMQRNMVDAGLYVYYYPSFEPTLDVSSIISEQKISIF